MKLLEKAWGTGRGRGGRREIPSLTLSKDFLGRVPKTPATQRKNMQPGVDQREQQHATEG